MQQQFFRGFGQPQRQVQNTISPELAHNTMVLEIVNNWEFVKELFNKIQKGDVDLVQQMEGEWINFFSGNKLDINSFKDEDDFMERNIRPLVKN